MDMCIKHFSVASVLDYSASSARKYLLKTVRKRFPAVLQKEMGILLKWSIKSSKNVRTAENLMNGLMNTVKKQQKKQNNPERKLQKNV